MRTEEFLERGGAQHCINIWTALELELPIGEANWSITKNLDGFESRINLEVSDAFGIYIEDYSIAGELGTARLLLGAQAEGSERQVRLRMAAAGHPKFTSGRFEIVSAYWSREGIRGDVTDDLVDGFMDALTGVLGDDRALWLLA